MLYWLQGQCEYINVMNCEEFLTLTKIKYRIAVANLHKETKKPFSEVMMDLFNMKTHGRMTPMISKFHHEIIQKNSERLNSAIVYDRDFNYQVIFQINF